MKKPTATRDPLKNRRAFRSRLVAWFREHGRDYPWRRTTDPYAILVSEIMLQQTQIGTVLGPKRYYEGWLEKFPDVHALAAAKEEKVLKAWEGLGYYRRARNLQKAARAVVEEHGGKFPETWEEIRALPGVGDYTAGAIVSFAYNQPAPVVDGNVGRVLARLFDDREEIDSTKGKKQLTEWAAKLVDPKEPRRFNSALMEIGQLFCLPRAPKCPECPVATFCQTRTPEDLPKKKPRAKIQDITEHVLYLRDGDRIFLHREPAGRRREGLWRLPEIEKPNGSDLLLRTTYGITRYRVSLHIHRGDATDAEKVEGRWFQLADISALPMASPYRKALDRLLRMEEEGDFQLL